MKYDPGIIGKLIFLVLLTGSLGCNRFAAISPEERGRKSDKLRIHWKENILTISGDELPGKTIEILYIEDFCKTGSTNRDWLQSIIPHKTELISTEANNTHIKLRTIVQPDLEVTHDIRTRKDEVEFNLVLHNKGAKAIDADWFQPCIRVDKFTGRKQEDYLSRSFIFTAAGLTTLDKTRRTEEALYKGGQVYVPAGINPADVNPRPRSPDQPVNGLIGCFSGDNRYLMATAWKLTRNYSRAYLYAFTAIRE
jgi:hypothetical protein